LIERNHRTFAYEAASPQLVSSLQNWLNGNGCIARAETAYLDSDELISMASTDDTVMTWLEALVDKALLHLRTCLQNNHSVDVSRDPHVHISPKPHITRIARILMTPLIVTLLLAPVIICMYLKSLSARLCVSIAAASLFIAILSGSTRAKSVELVVAGATYMTVLIVFISSTNVLER
jgi:hypothetical protein